MPKKGTPSSTTREIDEAIQGADTGGEKVQRLGRVVAVMIGLWKAAGERPTVQRYVRRPLQSTGGRCTHDKFRRVAQWSSPSGSGQSGVRR